MALDDSYTKALLHFDGADASTTFTDESGKTWTASGNAQIDTAQSVFGGASGLFDGTTSYISAPDHADFNFGAGDLTFDFRIRFNSLPADGTYQRFFTQTDGTKAYYVYIFKVPAGDYRFAFEVYDTSLIVALYKDITLSTNTWYHIAYVRNGSSWMVFKDGTQVGTSLTASVTCPDSTGTAYIATLGAGAGSFDGWMDEFRISKGIARWTSNFTPPILAYAPPSSVNPVANTPYLSV